MHGKQFSGMIGGTYVYRNNEYTIKSIDFEEDENYKVTTLTGKVIRLSGGELLERFVPVRAGTDDSKAVVLFEKMNTDLSTKTLISTLTDTLEKLKTDPAYIPQARAINETAKTIIDLGKLQVEIVRAVKGV